MAVTICCIIGNCHWQPSRARALVLVLSLPPTDPPSPIVAMHIVTVMGGRGLLGAGILFGCRAAAACHCHFVWHCWHHWHALPLLSAACACLLVPSCCPSRPLSPRACSRPRAHAAVRVLLLVPALAPYACCQWQCPSSLYY